MKNSSRFPKDKKEFQYISGQTGWCYFFLSIIPSFLMVELFDGNYIGVTFAIAIIAALYYKIRPTLEFIKKVPVYKTIFYASLLSFMLAITIAEIGMINDSFLVLVGVALFIIFIIFPGGLLVESRPAFLMNALYKRKYKQKVKAKMNQVNNKNKSGWFSTAFTAFFAGSAITAFYFSASDDITREAILMAAQADQIQNNSRLLKTENDDIRCKAIMQMENLRYKLVDKKSQQDYFIEAYPLAKPALDYSLGYVDETLEIVNSEEFQTQLRLCERDSNLAATN